ncbi:MAG: hypothetical protein H0U57_06010 [Tatlockia sp.]|nr:hypothetical protein [Tatlockia sp.]
MISKSLSQLTKRLSLAYLSFNYAPALFADSNPFPKIDSTINITEGNAMQKLATMVKNGGGMLLFLGCIVMFVQFMKTINHGVELAKKNEGSLTDFSSFLIMGIIQLVVCIAAGYAGYAVLIGYKP